MTSMIKLGCALASLFFAVPVSAQDFGYDELAGQIFWVKPATEAFRRLEFYRQPNLNAVTFLPQSKKSFRVISVTRGWVKVNFISAFNAFEEAFLPLGYLKRNTYTYKTYNEYAFNRATFFSEDPDEIKARAQAAAAPTVAPTRNKSIASKFFRHRKRCCGLDTLDQRDFSHKKTPAPQP